MLKKVIKEATGRDIKIDTTVLDQYFSMNFIDITHEVEDNKVKLLYHNAIVVVQQHVIPGEHFADQDLFKYIRSFVQGGAFYSLEDMLLHLNGRIATFTPERFYNREGHVLTIVNNQGLYLVYKKDLFIAEQNGLLVPLIDKVANHGTWPYVHAHMLLESSRWTRKDWLVLGNVVQYVYIEFGKLWVNQYGHKSLYTLTHEDLVAYDYIKTNLP